MIRIAKFLFAVGLGVFLHARFSAESKALPSDRRSKSSIEEVKAGCAEQKNAKRPKSIFESPEPPPRKEVVFHLEEGQVLNENQVYIKTPEGKAQLERNLGWLIDLCDNYALKQRQLAEQKSK
jgi:hypothetical protein